MLCSLFLLYLKFKARCLLRCMNSRSNRLGCLYIFIELFIYLFMFWIKINLCRTLIVYIGHIVKAVYAKLTFILATTVNGERYRWMISNFLWHILDDMDTDVVPTGLRYVPHTACHDGHSTRAIREHSYLWLCYIHLNWPPRSGFNAFRLLPLQLS